MYNQQPPGDPNDPNDQPQRGVPNPLLFPSQEGAQDAVRRGQRLVLGIAAAVVAVSLMAMMHLSARDSLSAADIVRLLLTAGMLWMLYEGATWARWLTIILLGLGALIGFAGLALGGLGAVLLLIMAVVYGASAVLLLISKDIAVFLTAQRYRV